MTEKQFTFDNKSLLKDNEFWLDGQLATLCNAEEICHELNELDSENKELKEGVEELNEICKYYEMRIKELSEQADAVRTELQLCEEENTELQKENEQLKQSVWSWSTSYNRVYQENQQLKNLIQHTYQIERTELGRNVLRQLLEAIQ